METKWEREGTEWEREGECVLRVDFLPVNDRSHFLVVVGVQLHYLIGYLA